MHWAGACHPSTYSQMVAVCAVHSAGSTVFIVLRCLLAEGVALCIVRRRRLYVRHRQQFVTALFVLLTGLNVAVGEHWAAATLLWCLLLRGSAERATTYTCFVPSCQKCFAQSHVLLAVLPPVVPLCLQGGFRRAS